MIGSLRSHNDVSRSAPPEIRVEALQKRYGGQSALDDVSFTVPAGHFMVLLGPSGSGKSTLLRCLAGLERVDGGEIRFDGRVVAAKGSHEPPEARHLAMVFQDFALWPHMTVEQNVAFALDRYGVAAKERSRQVAEMLERVGLSHLAGRFPNALSGGEQQRTSLARALVGRPGVVLFDEPLSSLDADLRERLRVEISALTRELGTTVVYITHDQTEAFALADIVGVLSGGALVQLGRPEEIYREPSSPFVARFTGLAGEVEGHLHQRTADGHCTVTTEAGVLQARSRGVIPIGAKVRVLLRSAPLHLRRDCGVGSALRGSIVDVAFRGRGYDHVVAISGMGDLMGVFSEERWNRHDEVYVEVPLSGALAFAVSDGRTLQI